MAEPASPSGQPNQQHQNKTESNQTGREYLEQRQGDARKAEQARKEQEEANKVELVGYNSVDQRTHKPLMPSIFPAWRKALYEGTETRLKSERAYLESMLSDKKSEIAGREEANINAEISARTEVTKLQKEITAYKKELDNPNLNEIDKEQFQGTLDMVESLLTEARDNLERAKIIREVEQEDLLQEKKWAEISYGEAILSHKQREAQLQVSLFWLTDRRWPGHLKGDKHKLKALGALIMANQKAKNRKLAGNWYSKTGEMPVAEMAPIQSNPETQPQPITKEREEEPSTIGKIEPKEVKVDKKELQELIDSGMSKEDAVRHLLNKKEVATKVPEGSFDDSDLSKKKEDTDTLTPEKIDKSAASTETIETEKLSDQEEEWVKAGERALQAEKEIAKSRVLGREKANQLAFDQARINQEWEQTYAENEAQKVAKRNRRREHAEYLVEKDVKEEEFNKSWEDRQKELSVEREAEREAAEELYYQRLEEGEQAKRPFDLRDNDWRKSKEEYNSAKMEELEKIKRDEEVDEKIKKESWIEEKKNLFYQEGDKIKAKLKDGRFIDAEIVSIFKDKEGNILTQLLPTNTPNKKPGFIYYNHLVDTQAEWQNQPLETKPKKVEEGTQKFNLNAEQLKEIEKIENIEDRDAVYTTLILEGIKELRKNPSNNDLRSQISKIISYITEQENRNDMRTMLSMIKQ